ncbi:transposase [Candidatus Jettenia caeni]|uniref:Transposase n=1 Tax=Candidatus Jettenia caeni TaxID=247490 RepID=I3IQA6_9BACT|nr:hypothetical protein [Candidatus Jettenia sp. AMX1]GAB63901.1 transposase [Candidatus Jettenia caeni]
MPTYLKTYQLLSFNNKLAKHDMRMARLKQKISETFYNKEMAECFCRIRKFISSVHKQSRKTTEGIKTPSLTLH